MPISEEDLKDIIKDPNVDIEKFTTISDDGKNLLTRIPKEIVNFLRLNKGNKIRWQGPFRTYPGRVRPCQVTSGDVRSCGI